MAETRRKTFEFRMSKKVAELTQVVHMLFTRNHEKEVELEAVKESYEYEIELVISDAKSKISKLEATVTDLEQRLKFDGNNIKLHYEKLANEKQSELKTNIDNLEQQLQTEKQECQTARDLLINAQMDIEKLRNGQGELTKCFEDIKSKNKEIERLKSLTSQLEKQLKDKDNKSNTLLSELQSTCDKSQKEINMLKEKCEAMQRARDEYGYRNKQLEAELRTLRNKSPKSPTALSPSKPEYRPMQASFMDYNEELEKLRREVARYRNELSNREDNFNRMFTDHQPVFVDKRAGKMVPPGGPNNKLQKFKVQESAAFLLPKYNREKSVPTYAMRASAIPRFPEEDESSQMRSPSVRSQASSSAGSSRLPTLGLDHKSRITRMLKPRPLPREVLSGKSRDH